MKLVSQEEFLKWIKAHDTIVDIEEEAGRRCRILPSKKTYSRYWVVRERASAVPFFLSKILEGLDPWEKCWLWKDDGEWSVGFCERSLEYHRVLANIMHGMNIPEGFRGALEYSKDEFYDIVTVLSSQIAYGWSVTDNIFVIPDHGKQIVWTDHCDDLVLANFVDENRLKEFIDYLAKHDIKLPTKPPDATLKPEDWMEQ